jgi:hypothetical protein
MAKGQLRSNKEKKKPKQSKKPSGPAVPFGSTTASRPRPPNSSGGTLGCAASPEPRNSGPHGQKTRIAPGDRRQSTWPDLGSTASIPH